LKGVKMDNFYIQIQAIKDKRTDNYLKSFDNYFLLYGDFEVYKNENENYQAKCPIKIILDNKIKKAYVLCQGSLVYYGKVLNVSRTNFKDNKNTLYAKRKTIENINHQINELKEHKKELLLKYIK
jgi:hypothetical protein